ncbi:MAG: hypothetical protein R3A11_09820 [Bdellovibrionota bacterium]
MLKSSLQSMVSIGFVLLLSSGAFAAEPEENRLEELLQDQFKIQVETHIHDIFMENIDWSNDYDFYHANIDKDSCNQIETKDSNQDSILFDGIFICDVNLTGKSGLEYYSEFFDVSLSIIVDENFDAKVGKLRIVR